MREHKRRYDVSEKGRARVRRYQQTAKGRAAKQRANASAGARRIVIGARHAGMADTPEQAAHINAHIKRRLNAFARQQAGAQIEGAATGAVPTEAEL